MGCGLSSDKTSLSEDDKVIIKQSWNQFCDGNIVENGKQLFLCLFEKIPEVKEVFYFDKDSKVSIKMFGKNRQFDTHVKRVFEMIGFIVSDLDNKKALDTRLVRLGSQHAKFAIKKEYFLMFGECLIYCLEKKLQDEFTPDVKEAWMNLINYMNPHVLAGWTMTMDQFQENG